MNAPPSRPHKTLADYFAIAISPALIMLLVGSLCFFLIEVFYRGEAVGNVRWVMFWFVLAAVLVSRIGIEQGTTHAMVYGLALGVATWLYLTHVHPAYLLGAIMLGIVWWCAHKLTWDCTLIDEDEDASGTGLLQTAWKKFGGKDETSSPPKKRAVPKKPREHKGALHPPGRWLIYFSLAALPLFGIGQMLLPVGDPVARGAGFEYLFIYLCAALGLLLTTSFLGLRRYLRQRYLPMPAGIALGWLKFGAGLGVLVLLLALLAPRPGAIAAWGTLRYHIDYQLHRASEYALRFSPHGSGHGNNGHPSNTQQNPPSPSQNGNQQSNSGKKTPGQSGSQSSSEHSSPASKSPPALHTPAGILRAVLKWLLFLASALLVIWWIYRRRELLLTMIREFWAGLIQFFRNLFNFRLTIRDKAVHKAESKPQPFASFQNPFATGEARPWTPEQLILHS